ncbi:uncharacterized protein LOC118451292 [Vespa mandarinia]|uniref:uncharacterized protein LOC118451292 n=1 Tax=Vespa mandarinia TaxID=7446 RepID=UPI0016139073|nr:uncharacterized protein LOC118451292 [Vespa mandarinia]
MRSSRVRDYGVGVQAIKDVPRTTRRGPTAQEGRGESRGQRSQRTIKDDVWPDPLPLNFFASLCKKLTVLNVQEGELKIPFNKPPPNQPLLTMTNLLPADADEKIQKADTFAKQKNMIGKGRRSELLRRSPDGGEFLLSQPIPDVGAFCYIAVLSKKE